MSKKKSPRLRTVTKVVPPFPLNSFPRDFGFKIAREIVYLLATKGKPVLEGQEWEEIFANCVGATWKPSNVGLDDVVLDNCAWGAKTVKSKNPAKAKTIRLISGRNNPRYSFGVEEISEDPEISGRQVLEIWNERVSAIRKIFKHVRTAVLLKSTSLEEVAVFEFETIRYDPELFFWKWNKSGNLLGYDQSTSTHKFTWQPHGSQFTIKENVPDDCLIVRIKMPKRLKKEQVLKSLGFDKSWVTIVKKNGR